MINEDALEQLCIRWLKEVGWSYLHGDVIAPDGERPERTGWRDTVLRPRLLAALARINPGITQAAMEAADHAVVTIS
ncbi:MAG: hypothetical protein EON58_13625, partial [Alphaproteobacteria bacterium]